MRRVLQVIPLPKTRFPGGPTAIGLAMQEWDEWFRASNYDIQYQNSVVVDRADQTQGKLDFGNLRSAMALRGAVFNRCRAETYDLIHIHSSYSMGMLKDLVLSEEWARRLGIPIAFHIHFAELASTLPKRSPFKQAALAMIKRGRSHLVLLGEGLKTELAAKGIQRERMSVLPNFHLGKPQSPPPKEKGKVRLLFLGSLDRRKGFFDLLAALETMPDKDWELNVGGRFLDPELEQQFERRVDAVRDRVHMHGYISGEKKADILKSSDVLVLPSYGEGMPVVILEAMAVGCAILTTNVGAIDEVIDDGVQGRLFNPGDVNTLSSSIGELIDQPELLEMMQANSYRDADKFSPQKFRERLVSIYDDVLS